MPSEKEEAVSAAQANRRFSQLLRGVRAGRRYLVTSHGKPVARIVPFGDVSDALPGARDALLERLRRAGVVEIGKWTRDELYENGR